jgi:hypothetical protein
MPFEISMLLSNSVEALFIVLSYTVLTRLVPLRSISYVFKFRFRVDFVCFRISAKRLDFICERSSATWLYSVFL